MVGLRGKGYNLKTYTREDVIRMLKAKQGDRYAKDFAEELKVSPPHLHDVYAGNRPPTPKILKFLGLRREKTTVTTYFELNGDKK